MIKIYIIWFFIKNSFILVDFAVDMACNGVFFNMGQVCTAGSRTYVHEEIYDAFLKKCVENAKKRNIGDGFDSMNDSGPQV